jgi:parallel beta-helix repeat protein
MLDRSPKCPIIIIGSFDREGYVNRECTLVLSLVVFACSYVSAAIINVPGDYPTIQQGIDVSSGGDTVLVQPGTYAENISFTGHNIVLGSLYLTTRDTSFIAETIIDGDSAGSVVTFESSEDSTASITGFTICRGYALYGAGIFCQNSNPTIRGNIVSANSAIYYGGGIYCDSARPIVSENTIAGNSSISGGGIYCTSGSWPAIVSNLLIENSAGWGAGLYNVDSNPHVTNNIFNGNMAAHNGGAIFCRRSGPTIAENIIVGNTADENGGGIYCETDSDPPIIRNDIIENASALGGGVYCYFVCDPPMAQNIIRGNSVSQQGGGIYCGHNSNPIIINNTISENMADISGGGIFCEMISNPTIANAILWGDSATYCPEIDFDDSSSPTFRYCDIEGGWGGEGNIDIDPLFRDPENGDSHLMSTACGDPYESPCIDAGDPSIFDYLLDCDWGLGSERSDMGTYGGQAIPTDIREEPEREIPLVCGLLQNYPNPFNSSTTIEYALSEASDVKIEIFDILGRHAETLVNEKQRAGYHQVIWNANDHSSGLYFCRIQAGEYVVTKKMVLSK